MLVTQSANAWQIVPRVERLRGILIKGHTAGCFRYRYLNFALGVASAGNSVSGRLNRKNKTVNKGNLKNDRGPG